ncbi:MAG TPA: hypothetical protein VLA97_06305 [Nocardioidaceae bacterium]|nr:hypothetical protein [Nocardioidaceae bacterium]
MGLLVVLPVAVLLVAQLVVLPVLGRLAPRHHPRWAVPGRVP